VVKQAERKQIYPPIETIILTGDLDALQLVDNNTKVYTLKKGVKDTVLYDEEKVKEKMQGLTPDQIVDYKSLRGDPSDNIPGVTGIGEKIAIDLLLKFGSLDNVYNNLNDIKPAVREKLLNQKDQALISKMLAQIDKDVPIDFNLKECEWKSYNKEEIIKIFDNYEFKTLINRLPENNLTLL